MGHSTRPLTFAATNHNRAVERRLDPAWLDDQWTADSARALVVYEGEVEVEGSGEPRWLATKAAPVGERYLLGIGHDHEARFAVHVDHPRESADYQGLRHLVQMVGAEDSDWLCHAVALVQWHSTHTHCPRCGGPTVVGAAGAERRCPADGSAHFPRVDPAVIVLVRDGDDRALLGHQESWPAGRFSTLAGFVEPGETAEQAVVREVAEESSVLVGEVELLATQPWPFPSSLMIGASARAEGSPVPRPDGEEMSEVRWFTRQELHDAVRDQSVMVPGPISISRWLIDRWYDGELPDDNVGWR